MQFQPTVANHAVNFDDEMAGEARHKRRFRSMEGCERRTPAIGPVRDIPASSNLSAPP
jgi:hypothetical protein